MKYTVSVIMTVYEGDNDSHFYEALNSLISNKNFISEVVLVRNGSISLSKIRSIINAKKHFTFKEICLKENIGLSKALNIAIENASSEWLARFDSDDLCINNRFEFIQKKIKKYGKKYDVLGTFINEFVEEKKDILMTRKVPLEFENIKSRLFYMNPMNHVTVFFKKSITDDHKEKSFYPYIDGFEDYGLWVKLISKGYKFKNFPDVTVLVRVGNNMLKRRGGLKYIFKEIKLRMYMLKFAKGLQIFIIFLFMIFRITAFLMPISIKRIIYKILRS